MRIRSSQTCSSPKPAMTPQTRRSVSAMMGRIPTTEITVLTTELQNSTKVWGRMLMSKKM